MKSILFAATAALAVSLQAEVTANNTLCRIEVSSAAKSVIVAVPLVAVGGSDESSVKVTNYIMTTNLQEGDSILQWNGEAWEGWVINKEGAWEAATSVSLGGVTTAEAASGSALSRGAAVWLNRPKITEAASFYLYGQVSSKEVKLQAQAGGYTLLSNPTTAELDFSSLKWNDCSKGDQILFAGSDGKMKSYTYRIPTDGAELAWCKKTFTVNGEYTAATWTAITTGDVVLAPGAGFWYNSKGSIPPYVTIQ